MQLRFQLTDAILNKNNIYLNLPSNHQNLAIDRGM
jgi:hypothetical protein